MPEVAVRSLGAARAMTAWTRHGSEADAVVPSSAAMWPPAESPITAMLSPSMPISSE